MIDLQEILGAWQARDWYALVVIAIVALMRLVTQTPLWGYVGSRWQWLPPVLLGAVAGLVEAHGQGLPPGLAVVQMASAGLQIGLGAVGVHHALKRVAGNRSSLPPGLFAGLLTLGTSSCGGPQRQACYAQAEARAHLDAEASCDQRGVGWDECPDAPRILAELQAAQEACP